MKIIKYLFFIFIGILIYILLNTYERFNISAAPWIYFDKTTYDFNTLLDRNTPPIVTDYDAVEGRVVNNQYYQEMQEIPQDIALPDPPESAQVVPSIRKIGYLIDTHPTDTQSELTDATGYSLLHFSDTDATDYSEPICEDGDTTSCYYRKINPVDPSNSEFFINLFDQNTVKNNTKIMDDEITGPQVRLFDSQLDRPEIMQQLFGGQYKLFVTDNYSLLKIYSLLNKFYIENADTPASNIPKPILYLSCHAEYLNEPNIDIANLDYLHRDLKFHVVSQDEDDDDDNGCVTQKEVNLTESNGYQQNRPEDNIQARNHYSRYQIPIHFKHEEFIDPDNNAFLKCDNCYMFILYQDETNEHGSPGDYFQYGSSTINSVYDKHKNLNLMKLFSMITKYTYDEGDDTTPIVKKVPIMFKSYNFGSSRYRNVRKFPTYIYYDVNGLWNEIIETLTSSDFQDSYKVTNCYEARNLGGVVRPPTVVTNPDNYPLNLFLDGCTKAYELENTFCKFLDMVVVTEGKSLDELAAEANVTDPYYNPSWDTAAAAEQEEEGLNEECKPAEPKKRKRDDDYDGNDKSNTECGANLRSLRA